MCTMLLLMVLRKLGSLNVVLQSDSGKQEALLLSQLTNNSTLKSNVTRCFANIIASSFLDLRSLRHIKHCNELPETLTCSTVLPGGKCEEALNLPESTLHNKKMVEVLHNNKTKYFRLRLV